jgi:hypothetical protein
MGSLVQTIPGLNGFIEAGLWDDLKFHANLGNQIVYLKPFW